MKFKTNGFTIVELLIVIVVISILATITVVAFNGVQTRANNATRFKEVQEWNKIFQLYAAQNGTYPNLPTRKYCLGTGYPVGFSNEPRCQNYEDSNAYEYPGATSGISVRESDNAPLLTELKTVSSTLPATTKVPFGTIVGPWVQSRGPQQGPVIYQTFYLTPSGCPEGTVVNFTGSKVIVCTMTLPDV